LNFFCAVSSFSFVFSNSSSCFSYFEYSSSNFFTLLVNSSVAFFALLSQLPPPHQESSPVVLKASPKALQVSLALLHTASTDFNKLSKESFVIFISLNQTNSLKSPKSVSSNLNQDKLTSQIL
jgi:hypothetical protein